MFAFQVMAKRLDSFSGFYELNNHNEASLKTETFRNIAKSVVFL